MRPATALRSALSALSVAGLLVAGDARAHGFAPAFLELREARDGRIEVLWKVPLAGEAGAEGRAAGEVKLPAACREVARAEAAPLASAVLERYAVDCGPRGIGGLTLTLAGSHDLDAIVSVRFAGGQRFTGVLRPGAPSLELPSPSGGSVWQVARGHLGLGVKHIATGADHLMFVLGLILLVRRPRALVYTISAFTLGHSLTLALAALDLVRVAQAPVEAAIALSILLLAVELTDRGKASWTRRAPWAVAAGFGLLHGFGFAGALAEAGLPPGNVATALLFFNLGVEAGQLAFVALVLGFVAALRRRSRGLHAWARKAVPYAIGASASYWLLVRGAAILGWAP